MTPTVFRVGDFAGLDLVSSPDQSDCFDLLNVDLDERGAVQQRDGYANLTGSDLGATVGMLHALRGATPIIVADSVATLYAVNTSGTTTASHSKGFSDACSSMVTFRNLDGTYVYVGHESNLPIRYNVGSASWSVPTATVNGTPALAFPKAAHLAVTPWDGRLVAANASEGPQGEPSSRNHVWFSAAQDPTTWSTDDFVALIDDEYQITAIGTWGDRVFVFKAGSFYVFSSTSVDATGGAVFNYRREQGVGSQGPLVAIARDGIYFVGNDGLYRTRGGPAELVSYPVNPAFVDTVPAHSTVPELFNGGEILLSSDGNRVYCTNNAGTTYIYDTVQNIWLVWSGAWRHVVPWSSTNSQSGPTDLFLSVGQKIAKMSPASTTDAGTNISSHYRTGFYDMGYPGQEKNLGGTRVWGTGTVAVSASRDFDLTLDTATNVTLGTAPAIDDALHNKAPQGVYFSYKFASVSGGAWVLHGYEHELVNVSPVGARSR